MSFDSDAYRYCCFVIDSAQHPLGIRAIKRRVVEIVETRLKSETLRLLEFQPARHLVEDGDLAISSGESAKVPLCDEMMLPRLLTHLLPILGPEAPALDHKSF